MSHLKYLPLKSARLFQIPRQPWENSMVIALACEQISDSFCLATNEAWGARYNKQLWFKNSPRISELSGLSGLFFPVLSGFAELQTDMTDLTKELNRSQGIPFLEYKQFVTRTFFPKVRKTYFSSAIWFRLADWQYHFSQWGLNSSPYMSHFTFPTACNIQDKTSPWNF